MPKSYKEYKSLDLQQISKDMLHFWEDEKVFEESLNQRAKATPFIFYEGPPSANGTPGIHHVMARAIKDIFCRYKTQKGFFVNRKAGWDTHGLPVELSVEKELGITKEDIGKKISVQEYNQRCREAVMKYTGEWNELTRIMGYWVDMENPYITYENKYIESVWHLLKKLHDKNFLYKGYTIQPYSPAAGTGLSSHELNQPGCYKNVKDTSIIAQFKALDESKTALEQKIGTNLNGELFFLAWTTTPWTLPANTALCVGLNIDYVVIRTFNSYTFKNTLVVVAKNLVSNHFNLNPTIKPIDTQEEIPFFEFLDNKNDIDKESWIKMFFSTSKSKSPGAIIKEFKGSELKELKYEQLLPYTLPYENADQAFRVITGDFVTTEDGTGIVHIAPTFGADDMRVAKQAGVPSMLVLDENEKAIPIVDLTGKYIAQMGDLAGKFVKNEYYPNNAPDKSLDVEIAIKLKEANRAFKVEKYEHSYPHCWRTDKPILYYPLDSWFVKTTAAKEQLIALNKTINWKPEHTGTGRFENWLQNLQDWNLSRSRYWGIPIPIWSSEDGSERKIIGSVEELKYECDKALKAGFMQTNPLANYSLHNFTDENYQSFDLHRPFVDEIILVSESGKALKRESDLIDVWFDSGSMPYAQVHYPFSQNNLTDGSHTVFPADFIAEGVDQTRGWFFTLHAIATLCFNSVAFKNVISNGLVLDKNGNKMSKRLGNAVDPFKTINTYGADATRWYMITNAQPWDNLKFDEEGIVEVQRKFFRALHNTYAFFALYANVDNFNYKETEIAIEKRPEIDRWILSKLHSLIKEVDEAYTDYEPTKAGRAIQDFVVDDLSNWYVRLCRRRFWKGDYSDDKIAAYQTLYTCLVAVTKLAAPIAPFYCDNLYRDLNAVTSVEKENSVHLTLFPEYTKSIIDKDLEERMNIAQKISSLVLGLRKKQMIRVRQPLQKIMVPILNDTFKRQLEAVKDLILFEVNVKELAFITEDSGILTKRIKPNFKTLGPKFGKLMKSIATAVSQLNNKDIALFESEGNFSLSIENETIQIELEDVEISSDDIPGWIVATEGSVTVALDIQLTESLLNEGTARELVNRIQNLRKEMGLDVTDKVNIQLKVNESLKQACIENLKYICSETLTENLLFVDNFNTGDFVDLELEEELNIQILITKKQ